MSNEPKKKESNQKDKSVITVKDVSTTSYLYDLSQNPGPNCGELSQCCKLIPSSVKILFSIGTCCFVTGIILFITTIILTLSKVWGTIDVLTLIWMFTGVPGFILTILGCFLICFPYLFWMIVSTKNKISAVDDDDTISAKITIEGVKKISRSEKVEKWEVSPDYVPTMPPSRENTQIITETSQSTSTP